MRFNNFKKNKEGTVLSLTDLKKIDKHYPKYFQPMERESTLRPFRPLISYFLFFILAISPMCT